MKNYLSPWNAIANCKWLFRRIVKVDLNNTERVLAAGSLLLTHFVVNGALLGLNLKLDPWIKPKRWASMVALGLLVLLCGITTGTLQLGLLMVLTCPIWLYVLPRIRDIVMENRSYLALPALAVLGATTANEVGLFVLPLVVLLGVSSMWRNRLWTSREDYWIQCAEESPGHVRPKINRAVVYTRRGQLDKAISEYTEILMTKSTEYNVALA